MGNRLALGLLDVGDDRACASERFGSILEIDAFECAEIELGLHGIFGRTAIKGILIACHEVHAVESFT